MLFAVPRHNPPPVPSTEMARMPCRVSWSGLYDSKLQGQGTYPHPQELRNTMVGYVNWQVGIRLRSSPFALSFSPLSLHPPLPGRLFRSVDLTISSTTSIHSFCLSGSCKQATSLLVTFQLYLHSLYERATVSAPSCGIDFRSFQPSAIHSISSSPHPEI